MRNRTAVLVLAVILVVGMTAGALAYWSSSGDGEATAVLGSPEQLSLTPGTPQAQLSPGHDATVDVIATNTNPYFVNVRSLELDTAAGSGGFEVDAAHSGCDVSVLSLSPRDNGGAGWRVPPRVASADGTLEIGLGDALEMDRSASAACQGATFTVHLVEGS